MHYMMGGVRVDPDTQMSTVPGLFAAGECAGGMHGANRLGGNSLSDLLVFGKLAGAGAAEHAKKAGAPATVDAKQIEAASKEVLAPFDGQGENPYAVHRDLQEAMSTLVGIFRIQEDLEKAVGKLEELRARARKTKVEGSRAYNPGWHLALDLLNMIDVSEAVALACLTRQESRGAHSRLDFPDLAPRWSKVNVCVRERNGSMEVVETPLPEMPAELKALFEEKK
jgi:succinate dehydrogenase / fumarate reductase flavoprotein subunit